MNHGDLAAATVISAAAFGLDLGDPASGARWRARVEHGLEHDPGGAFVAERHGRIIGIAEAIRRERLWCLSLLTVDPDTQSAGAGRALMERALGYAEGTDAGPYGALCVRGDPGPLWPFVPSPPFA